MMKMLPQKSFTQLKLKFDGSGKATPPEKLKAGLQQQEPKKSLIYLVNKLQAQIQKDNFKSVFQHLQHTGSPQNQATGGLFVHNIFKELGSFDGDKAPKGPS